MDFRYSASAIQQHRAHLEISRGLAQAQTVLTSALTLTATEVGPTCLQIARKFQLEVRNMVRKQAPNLTQRTVHSAPYMEFKRSFRSQTRAIPRSVAEVMRFMRNFRKMDGSESEIETALREALENAVVHGNGREHGKRVYVDCRCYMDGEVSITVQDEGRGFDTNAASRPHRARQPAVTARSRYLPHEEPNG